MAFNRPTLQELVTRIGSDLESRTLGGSGLLRRAVNRVLARVIAGAAHLLHGRLDWIAKQTLPDTAEDEGVRRWGKIFQISPKPATFAKFTATFPGTNGSTFPEDTEIQRPDGKTYTADASGLVAGGEVTIEFTATESGAASNVEEGEALSLTSPVAGITSEGLVEEITLEASDEEGLEDYRERVLERFRQPPHGGAANDYETWAKEVAGVTRAWVYPNHMGAGTVGVTFVLDGSDPIIPEPAKVAEVQAYIEDPARAPVICDLFVFAPTAVPLNFQIEATPDNPSVRAAIAAELEDLILREAEPAGTLLISHIREAISKASGETDYTLVSPTADVTVTAGNLTTMGTITWV